MEKIIVFILLLFTLNVSAQSTKDLEKALYACDSSYTLQGQHLQKAITSDSLKTELIAVYKEQNSELKKELKRGKIKPFIKGTLVGVAITFITLILI